jgi:hypothetical protein
MACGVQSIDTGGADPDYRDRLGKYYTEYYTPGR